MSVEAPMFDVTKWTAEDLHGGRIAEIVKHFMASDDAEFGAALEAVAGIGDEMCDAFEVTFGWRPPAELVEYVEADAALAYLASTREDFWLEELGGWIFSLDLGDFSPEARADRSFFAWTQRDPLVDSRMLLTGLVQFGMDASGDTCVVSALPRPDDVAEVWRYDHEVGRIHDHLGHSITGALLCAGLDDSDWPEPLTVAEREGGGDFARDRPPYLAGDVLHARADWLISLLSGEPGYAFEARLGDAPTFATWEGEKAAAAELPHLAMYWMFAHYFFGNVAACKEALGLVRSAAGRLGAALADQLEAVIEHSQLGLGEIDAESLTRFRALVHSNADPTQLDPTQRAALRAERGDEATDRERVARDLAAGKTPMQIIEAFPHDVALHDEMLERIAAEDDEFADWVEEYKDERTAEAYNEWPYDDVPDRRLSLPISAAFRAGLKYGPAHKNAFSGVTRTLARFDDEHAIDAYRDAIRRLGQDDERLEFVIEQLAESKQPAAYEVLVEGALRFFEHLETLAASKAARATEWPSLNDLFRVDDYLIRALLHAMRPSDDEAESASAQMLARRTLASGGRLATLGVAWCRAMQVVAHYELDDLVYLARGFVETFRDTLAHAEATSLGPELILNLSESARVVALRQPDTAGALLRPIFEGYYPAPGYQADVIGCMLAGMIVLEPAAPDVLEWTERILGSRCERRPTRLYGALTGVATARLDLARDWVWPHLWAGYSGINESRSIVGNAALRAMKALGVDEAEVPAFDDDDWYASELESAADLLAALDEPHRYGAENVLERLGQQGHVSEAVASRIGDWFVESLRFAEDDPDRESHRDRWEALRVLLGQGPFAVDQFERIFATEHIGGEWLGYAIQFARFSALFAAAQEWLRGAADDEILDAISEPSPRWTPFLDHLAAEAIVRGIDARDALESANIWRSSFAPSYALRDDLVASRLPRLYAMFGKGEAFCREQLETADAVSKNYWEQALATSAPPTPVGDFVGDGEMSLVCSGECWFDARLIARLSVEGVEVRYESTVSDFHTRSVLPDATWSGRYEVSLGSPQEAVQHANRLVARLSVLGMTREA